MSRERVPNQRRRNPSEAVIVRELRDREAFQDCIGRALRYGARTRQLASTALAESTLTDVAVAELAVVFRIANSIAASKRRRTVMSSDLRQAQIARLVQTALGCDVDEKLLAVAETIEAMPPLPK